jgi:transketolase
MKRIDERSIVTLMMLAADAVQKANSGHPGMPMGDATMAYYLWQRFLKHNPKNPQWHNRDRFVLSAGHGSMLLYSLLHLTGHNISMDDIKDFRQWESKTPGHPEYCLPCGIETTTGPLGQGFATGVGMAMAEKFLSKAFNKPGFKLVDYYIYGIVSDGDIMEGVQAEAASLAGHLGLGKIIYLYSDNKITIEGSTDLTFTEDVERRFKAYGWHTEKVDGYDEKGIVNAIKKAQQEKDKPSLILARTLIGYCCPNKQNTSDVHGAPLGEEEIRLAKKQCEFPNRKFYVPGEVLKHMRTAVTKGRQAEANWNDLFRRYKKKYPAASQTWEEMATGKLPEGWEKELPKFKPGDGSLATRSASGKVLNALAPVIPNLIGGSADLAPSNNTELKGFPAFTTDRAGRNIHFGVREHAMGAALNGMALSKMLIPYGGTFLIFSDYLRPASRLSSLMGTHVVYVMTHDSVGLGEDGPTHQPVEHLTSYRAMPNMTVIRPCDANETVEAWRMALKNTHGPVMLVLSRQKLPILDRKQYNAASGLRRGGYVLSDSKKKYPDLLLIATGSEVHLALEAADDLRKSGKDVRVVSMPCCELFDAQPEKYRNEVLPPSVTARVAVEAGASLSWHKYVGADGAVLGIDRFGASAPAKVIFEKLGFTAKNVVAVARGLKKRRK